MIFSKLLLINTLQRLEAQTLGHYCLITSGKPSRFETQSKDRHTTDCV